MGLTTRQFRQQHRELLSLAGQLTAILDQRRLDTDPGEARRSIERLAAHLRHHLDAEDHGLYVKMQQSADPQVRSTAALFATEMSGIAGAFTAYVKAWPEHAIRSDPGGFDAATRAVLGALRLRIERENDGLYPLADGLEVSADAASAATAGRPPTVFIVDDNDGDFLLLKEAWRETDATCCLEHFPVARKLLDRVAQPAIPDLLVIDFNMPVIGGPELVQTLRAVPVFKRLPVVMCSSGAAPGDSDKATACGATGFFPKPATFEEYLPFVRAMNDMIAYYRPR